MATNGYKNNNQCPFKIEYSRTLLISQQIMLMNWKTFSGQFNSSQLAQMKK